MSMCNLHNGGMSVSVLLAILLAASAPVVSAQDIGGGTQIDGKRINSIITAAPFLMIAPDSRSGGMGRSEEHTSELQSLMRISYAVFCLKKKNNNIQTKCRN